MSRGVSDLFSQLVQNDYGFFERITLSDIMTTEVKELSLDDTHEQVADFFQRHSIHHAPVVADDGDVVGIVSDRDLLRHQPPFLGTAAEGDKDYLATRESVASFMTRGTISLLSHESPITALSLMLDHHVDCVLVHDDDTRLRGIVTTRDFMKMALLFHQVCSHGPSLERFRLVDLDFRRGLSLDLIFSRCTRTVRDVMTKEVRSLLESDTIGSAIKMMKMHEVRHVPIVDDSDRLVGIVSDRDVLKFLPLPVPRRDLVASADFREALFALKETKILGERLGAIMNRSQVSVTPDSLLMRTLDIFMAETLSGVAVVENEENRLCGILTTTDILRVFRNALHMGQLSSTSKNPASGLAETVSS